MSNPTTSFAKSSPEEEPKEKKSRPVALEFTYPDLDGKQFKAITQTLSVIFRRNEVTLYKGRVGSKPNELMNAINRSLPVDIRLFPYDVATNRAWASELCRIGVFSPKEFEGVEKTLDDILDRYGKGEFDTLPEDEDIHTLTERLITEKLGDTGARIHTGRSRNDQVACDMHLYMKEHLALLARETAALISTVKDTAEKHAGTLLAGTTHLQPAQPITLGHFLLSLAFALTRDAGRFQDALVRVNRCPLGAGAIAGSGFAVDRDALAEKLGFDRPTENSIDTTSHRDGAQETALACAIMLGHLSRYAEQFIIWTNPAFGYVRWSDTWSTGSSMMPQKRNPDAMELVRSKAARAEGNAMTLLAMTKGVPLSYAKDLQEDKAALFDSVDTALLTLRVFSKALESATFLPDNMRSKLTSDMLATELADALVEKGIPFRKAHERTAQFVTTLENDSRGLLDATPEELDTDFPELTGKGFKLDYETAVKRRIVKGGTSPESVTEQIAFLDDWLAQQRDEVQSVKSSRDI